MPASGLTLYRLHTPEAIGAVLQELHQQQGVLSLYAHSGAADGVPETTEAAPCGLASVTAVNVDARTCMLAMTAPIVPLPEQALAVAHMAGSVRVQYLVQGAWTQLDGKHWQLTMPWPEHMLQLQRRRHPRVHVPLGHNYSASFLFGRRRCVLDIEDLSQGGLALRGTRKETAMLFVGRELHKVTLRMADGSTLEVALTVRSRRSYQSFLLGEQVLVGCSVEKISSESIEVLDALLASGMQPLLAG